MGLRRLPGEFATEASVAETTGFAPPDGGCGTKLAGNDERPPDDARWKFRARVALGWQRRRVPKPMITQEPSTLAF